MSDRRRAWGRRDVLRAGVATGTLAAASAFAGCGAVRDATSVAGGGGGEYTDWVYAPGATGRRNHYGFRYFDIATMMDNEGVLGDAVAGVEGIDHAPPLSRMSVDPTGFEFLLHMGPPSHGWGTIVEGNFMRVDLVTELDDDSFFDRMHEYDGFVIFESVGGALGVGDGDLVIDNREVADVETVIDTKNGDQDRYLDVSEDMALVLARLGDGAYVDAQTTEEWGSSRKYPGMVASGTSASIEGDVTSLTGAIVYNDQEQVDTDRVADELADTDFDDASVSQRGRAVVMSATTATEDFFSSHSPHR